MKLNLEELAGFLVKAKCRTYAGDGKEVEPQRPGFKELEFIEGDWEYRDSYVGFFFLHGQEVVRLRGKLVWVMGYYGGMAPMKQDDVAYAEETFSFLKKALLKVEKTSPFRGPNSFCEGDWKYANSNIGDIINFRGTETIYHDGIFVFRQDYFGGLVVRKR